MRVLFSTYPVAFDCPGGGEIQILKSKEALERAGIEVLLFDPWHPQLDQVDVVHYFSVHGGSINFCEHVKRKELPLLISCGIWLTENNTDEFPINEIRELLHLADLVVTNSSAEAQQLGEFFGLDQERFSLAHNGIDQSFSQVIPAELFRRRFGISQPFLLNVANIEPRKNQLRLLEAVKPLGLKLLVLGNIRDQAYFTECRRRASDTMIHLGYLDHTDDLLKSAYRACEVFVLPSLLETPGLAALEAAACGAKLVITEVGSTREYFGQMVRYVDPLDVGQITRAIDSQLRAEAPTGLGHHVLTRYTWDKTAAQLIKAYKQAITQHSPEGGKS